MKKYPIVIINVIIVLGVIIFVINYTTVQKKRTEESHIESFEDMTLAMVQITSNYLEQEQRICNVWATFINNSSYTMEEALAIVWQAQSMRDSISAHIIDPESRVGRSTLPRTDNPSDYNVSYEQYDIFKDIADISAPGKGINVTRAYTNPMNGIQSISFYNLIRLREADGGEGEYLLIRVVPAKVVTEKWVFPKEEYEKAEVSLVDVQSNYITKGKSFKNGSFFDFYKSYNETDYKKQSELERNFTAEKGSFTMLNSKGQECLIAHSPVNIAENWAIVSYIPLDDLGENNIDLSIILVVAVALFLLLIFDIWEMQLFNRALKISAEKAEHASIAKSDFLSNMSHEIRTPITAILGMNEMIQRESDNKEVLEYSDSIQTAGVSLLGIISDILDFSKIEAGKMELVKAPYPLKSLVSDLMNMSQLRAEGKGLLLKAEVDPSLPKSLIGDELRVKQIVTNILSNAVKYTERGSVVLKLALDHRDDDSVSILFSVTDTGIGIKPEEMDKLFTAFDRLDTVRTRGIEGTGLGLAITMRMLNMMGSKLEVESNYGEGSCFHFILKQEIQDSEEVGVFDPLSLEAEDRERRKESAIFTAPEAHILVVDDTYMNLQVIKGLLKRTKMQIDTASSGEECLKLLKDNAYDLIFLDYRMPEMDGIETLQKLKELYPECGENTPIICLTASAISGDREMMLNAGFTDYLTKPVNITEMENMLIHYLPDEKVIQMGESEDIEEVPLEELPKEVFNIPNLDPKAGIEFCGDAEEYMNALEIFYFSIDTKAAQIENCVQTGDFKTYTIDVHSLKSTSRAVGAMCLSNLAKSLEKAGDEGDEPTIKRDTPKLLKMFRDLKAPIGEALKAEAVPGPAEDGGELLSREEYEEALSSIKDLKEVFDYESISMIMDMLSEKQVPMELKESYDSLKEAVNRCDWDMIEAAVSGFF